MNVPDDVNPRLRVLGMTLRQCQGRLEALVELRKPSRQRAAGECVGGRGNRAHEILHQADRIAPFGAVRPLAQVQQLQHALPVAGEEVEHRHGQRDAVQALLHELVHGVARSRESPIGNRLLAGAALDLDCALFGERDAVRQLFERAGERRAARACVRSQPLDQPRHLPEQQVLLTRGVRVQPLPARAIALISRRAGWPWSAKNPRSSSAT